MKKLLVLLIASSLSLFATINGKDEIFWLEAIKEKMNVPTKSSDYMSLTDIYIEPNKTTPKGGKYIVLEYTFEAEVDKQLYEEISKLFKALSLSFCFLVGDKQDNIIVTKYRQYGKVIAEFKVDAKECNAAKK
ncbi:hypothetical protein N5T80_09720 [Aliarcobacter cryaerophilus]|uniref:hypothetical protein n=1 Tax=Aliarcobacter cryaerophilus TaxID=28198 RepID=UPI0021B50171|nr:hypothetical protein [Aliarcobacter cryaerophilus]MCT7533737.1 hypothetical protein [Aliarcobacter cryaerophilus]MCT7546594.1 hypothetical protein [Aliarcobacter cryaerophilus]